MNAPTLKRITDAVLYEGYILYPYRPAIKNRQRWTFGGLYPRGFACGSDRAHNQTECLVEGSGRTRLHVSVRYLHLIARTVGAYERPLVEWCETAPYRQVESLRIGDRLYQPWQEAQECEIAIDELTVGELVDHAVRQPFARAGRQWLEPLAAAGGEIVGVLAREQRALSALVMLGAAPVAAGVYRLTVRVANVTPTPPSPHRDEALLQTLASSHTVLHVEEGQFVSQIDPPERWRDAAAACANLGVWPVLVGEEGQRDTMLASPIILYDYPQVAPESPGDFFDGSEIDEMLTLRILTLTDEEKDAMAMVDQRARALLARAEAMDDAQLQRLHGAVRGMRPVAEDDA
jgi:hypothetical protein